ncbi:MAG: cell division protein ZipA [Pseudomonadales bacterium]
MEFSLREWLIFVGIIVILGVLLDGYRRVRSGSRGKLKMSIDKSQKLTESERMDYFNGELPNGGAREVNRGEEGFIGDDDMVQEPTVSAFDVAHELRPDPLFSDDPEPPMSEVFDVDHAVITEAAVSVERDVVVEAVQEAIVQPEAVVTESITESQPAPTEEKKPANYQDVEEVIVMNVFAKDDNGFNGSELMRVILACGMRYGEMEIFHRSEEGTNGAVQFSMANLVKPGTFALDNMDSFYTPGVSFFLSLPGPKDSLKALEYMYETAQCVVKNLNGELKDEMHSAMTKQTIEHSRQKVQDFERRQLSLSR